MRVKCTLFESRKLEDNLWETISYIVYEDGTEQTLQISHHSSKRESEEQNTINKSKFWNT